MADAPGLGPGVHYGRGGSTPLARIAFLVCTYDECLSLFQFYQFIPSAKIPVKKCTTLKGAPTFTCIFRELIFLV